jgi:lysine-ketoglutarate reductase/saccharopine dehydrogenase-like protein (TIGR00300 family)
MSHQAKHLEEVELRGHIIDSLLLPKVFDTILALGGSYVIKEMNIGEKQSDPSVARFEVRAENATVLEQILSQIHDHGAVPVHDTNCHFETADIEGAFPEGFYASTNFRTQVRVGGRWVDVQLQEMDCGIRIDKGHHLAECVPMVSVKKGDLIATGRKGIRVFPPDNQPKKHLFEFMSSTVSSEKPKGATVREIAAEMKRTREAGQKILAVLGPAVVHTGGSEWIGWMIQQGWLDVLFAGNALATHDLEQDFYGTSLGVSLDRGIPAEEGHEHHLRTINSIRRLGGIKAAVDAGKLKTGIMHACITKPIDFMLAGSIRDDGPLPEVMTDSIKAQDAMRAKIQDVGFCLMVATTLHSIAVGNLLPAWVKVACIDINPATVTKLMDRGSVQTIGIVSDAEPFLRHLVGELEKA